MSSYDLCIVMLVTLLTHANAIPVDNSLTMTRSSPTISQLVAFNSSLDDTRAEHRLRMDTETMANDGGDNFEERLLEGIGLGTTRIRTVLETMMIKLKLFINKAMTKFGLTKQSKVDKFFERIVQKSASNANEIPKLDSLDFQEWRRLTEITYKENFLGADAAMVRTLAKHYGDIPLVTMLSAAEMHPSTRYIAGRLLKAQFDRWRATGKSYDEFFKLLNLDKAVDELLQNPMMRIWISYVLAFDTPQAKMAWPVLLKHYKDEETIIAVLAKALVTEETEYVARQVMGIWLDHWYTVEAKSVDEAFKLLKLDEAGDKLLQNPMLEIWASFLSRFPDETQIEEAWPLLLKHYEDNPSALTKKLIEAMKEKETRPAAEKLLRIQIKIWHSEKKKDVDTFSLLQLEGKNPDNPLYQLWAEETYNVY